MFIATKPAPRRAPVHRTVARPIRRFLGDDLSLPSTPVFGNSAADLACAVDPGGALCAVLSSRAVNDPLAVANDAINVAAGNAPPSSVNADIQACQANALKVFNQGAITSDQLSQIQKQCASNVKGAAAQTPDVPNPVLNTLIPFLLIGGVLVTGVVIATH